MWLDSFAGADCPTRPCHGHDGCGWGCCVFVQYQKILSLPHGNSSTEPLSACKAVWVLGLRKETTQQRLSCLCHQMSKHDAVAKPGRLQIIYKPCPEADIRNYQKCLIAFYESEALSPVQVLWHQKCDSSQFSTFHMSYVCFKHLNHQSSFHLLKVMLVFMKSWLGWLTHDSWSIIVQLPTAAATSSIRAVRGVLGTPSLTR